MHRLGLSERGREDQGVRWVAVHHGDNHLTIYATTVDYPRRPSGAGCASRWMRGPATQLRDAIAQMASPESFALTS